MTDNQRRLVQSSFAKIAPIADTAAELFYGRLFELNGNLRPLFKGDMKEQGKMLMSMITLSVKGLDNLDALVPTVYELGRRHSDYGVEDSHYEAVGEALLWTLDKGLGDKFTHDVREAWTVTYTLLADTMKSAQKHVEERRQKEFASRLNAA